MKKYICKKCNYSIDAEDITLICPKCGSDKMHLVDEISSNEIDAIIDSMLEEAIEIKKSKITNINENDKFVQISGDNYVVEKNKEKCINCGQCKKVCENIANLSYNLNVCENPICTGCGQCILNCPTQALSIKKEYRVVKQIIDANEKIVVAILSPAVFFSFAELYDIKDIKIAEQKTIGILRKLGFDYVFSSSFGSDLMILEESSEFIERLSKKENIPFFTSSCPSWIKYAEIYHPELLNNISTCKLPIEMQNEVIKKYFSEKKGFDSNRIVTVSISNCSAYKEMKNENNLNTDYYLSAIELSLLISEEEIDIKTVSNSLYDNIVGETSGSGYMLSISGGHSEALIRTIYRIINKRDLAKDEIDIYELRSNEDIREATIKMGSFKMKVAVVSDMLSLEKILENNIYKQYHLIDVSYCKGGCINGGGQPIYINDNHSKVIKNISGNIYKLDKNCQNRFSHNNKELKEVYKKYLINPNSDISKNLFYTSYKNKSILLGKE